ncbi:hypothetical protein I4U23_018488 [Adineta vaga]|nr:hypothetical protein I4U23_018488 [Adineta vaga]
MIHLSTYIRRYFFITILIYFITIFFSFLIYVLLILLEKRIPLITLSICSIGETILNGLHFLITPLRYFLPHLTDDEYYLILIHSIITTFAVVYTYLFYIIRPDLFTNTSSIQNIVYSQWLDLQRHRFQEIRRAA